MRRVVGQFNDSLGVAEGIWVEYCEISNVDQRVLIAAAGGDPPDLAGLYDYNIAQFADYGALRALDELAESNGIRADSFKPVWWDLCKYKRRLYALPSAPYTIALHYNRRLFRAAGLDPDRPPHTISELDDYSRRLTLRDGQGRIVQAGFTPAPKILGWWHWVWPYFFHARLWDGNRFHLETEESRACFRWIAQGRRELGIDAALAFEDTVYAIEGGQNPFLSERVAMVFQGPWMANWVRTYWPDLDYAVAPFPSVDGRPAAFVSSDIFVIPRGARHPKEALRFLRFVLQPEVMEGLCQAHGKVSPFRRPREQFFEQHPNPHIRVFDDLALVEDAFGYPSMPTFKEVSNELLLMLEIILQGLREPEEALADVQVKIDLVVEQYHRLQGRRGSLLTEGKDGPG